MRQAVVYHSGARKWKDLGLILQATEDTREKDAVVVALERSAYVVAFLWRGVAFG